MNKPVFDSVFDLGTSPHGLSAVSKLPQEEARQEVESHSLADGFAIAPMVDALASTKAAGEPFLLTEELRRSAAFAVLNIASELEDGEESLENADEIARLWAVHKILEQGRPA